MQICSNVRLSGCGYESILFSLSVDGDLRSVEMVDSAVLWLSNIVLWLIALVILLGLLGAVILLITVGIQAFRALAAEIEQRLGIQPARWLRLRRTPNRPQSWALPSDTVRDIHH